MSNAFLVGDIKQQKQEFDFAEHMISSNMAGGRLSKSSSPSPTGSPVQKPQDAPINASSSEAPQPIALGWHPSTSPVGSPTGSMVTGIHNNDTPWEAPRRSETPNLNAHDENPINTSVNPRSQDESQREPEGVSVGAETTTGTNKGKGKMVDGTTQDQEPPTVIPEIKLPQRETKRKPESRFINPAVGSSSATQGDPYNFVPRAFRSHRTETRQPLYTSDTASSLDSRIADNNSGLAQKDLLLLQKWYPDAAQQDAVMGIHAFFKAIMLEDKHFMNLARVSKAHPAAESLERLQSFVNNHSRFQDMGFEDEQALRITQASDNLPAIEYIGRLTNMLGQHKFSKEQITRILENKDGEVLNSLEGQDTIDRLDADIKILHKKIFTNDVLVELLQLMDGDDRIHQAAKRIDALKKKFNTRDIITLLHQDDYHNRLRVVLKEGKRLRRGSLDVLDGDLAKQSPNAFGVFRVQRAVGDTIQPPAGNNTVAATRRQIRETYSVQKETDTMIAHDNREKKQLIHKNKYR